MVLISLMLMIASMYSSGPIKPGNTSIEPGNTSDEPGNTSDEPGNTSIEPGTYIVASYNLYWWNAVEATGNLAGLKASIDSIVAWEDGVDLIGFQECDDVNLVLPDKFSAVSSSGTSFGDVANAWRTDKFTLLEHDAVQITDEGIGQYSPRGIVWCRLKENDSGNIIFFVNTHGPLDDENPNCNNKDLGKAYYDAIQANIQENDLLIFTGDFNCISDSETIKYLIGQGWENAVTGNSYGGVDHIITDNLILIKKDIDLPGDPSDHQPIVGKFIS